MPAQISRAAVLSHNGDILPSLDPQEDMPSRKRVANWLSALLWLISCLSFAPAALAEYAFIGCPVWSTSGYEDSSAAGAIRQAMEPGIPAICRPVVVTACGYSSIDTTAQITCSWQPSNHTDSQCVALGTFNQSIAHGTGVGIARDINQVSHCAVLISSMYLDVWKLFGPCGNGNCPFGNPINVASANKYQVEADFKDPGGLLSFVRTYNSSAGAQQTNVGAGWSHNWGMSVTRFGSLSQAVVRRPDSKVFVFRLANGVWSPDADVNVKLEAVTGGWTVTGDDNSIETYNAEGLLTSLRNPAGMSVTLTYSDGTSSSSTGGLIEGTSVPLPAGLMIRATDFRGRTLEFRYNGSYKIVKVIDPQGQAYQYAYGSNNNLATVTYPGGALRTYHYNETAYTGGGSIPNGLTGITDENAVRFARFRYDVSWRAVGTEYVVPAGPVSQYSMSYSGNTATVTTPLGATMTVPHTVNLSVPQRTSLTKPCPGCGTSTETLIRDANSNITAYKDFNGNLTCSVFDTTRNLETSRVEGLSGTGTCASKVTTNATRTITTEWHSTWRLPKRIAEPLRITTYAYNGDPGVSCAPSGASTSLLCTKTVQANTDASGALAFTATSDGAARVTAYTYNVSGQLLTVDGPRSDVTDVTTYTYYTSNDPSGNYRAGDLATVVNAKGHTTQFTQYDAAGRLKKTIDPNGLETILDYWPRGWLKTRQVGSTGAYETTSYDYDSVGQLTKVTLPDASFIGYRYDNAHRLYEIYDGLNDKITYTLDNAGNRTAEETRDPNNTLVRKHTREFDVLGRLFKDIGGTDPTNQVTQYGFDKNDNVTSILDPLARTTTQEYDARNRLTKVKDPFNGATAPTQYGYNARDVLASVTDPKGLATTYTVNGHGETLTQASPDTGTTVFTYDAAGNVATKVDARPVTATYSYDSINRLTQIVYPDETVIYTYDTCTNGVGRLCSISDKTGTTTYTLDLQGRVTGKTQVVSGLTRTVGYAYNAAGQLASITTPSGQLIEYGYANNRPVSVKVNGTTVLDTAYWEPFGPSGGWRWGNSTTGSPNMHTRLFDLDYRPTRATSDLPLSGSTPALDRLVGWDKQSRVTSITDYANSALTATYGYDALDRLSSMSQGTNAFGFTYDGVGNRLTQTVNAITTTYTYPSTSHRLSSLSGGTARSFTYDNVGNQTGDGTATWTYGGNNRPTQVAAGMTTTFDVNALGQRVRKGSTWFAYDEQGRVLGEYSSGGALTQETVWLKGMPVATLRPNGSAVQIYYVHPDHLGAPRAITRSSDNELMWNWGNNEPFGGNTPNQNPNGLGIVTYNLRFPGQYYDSETGSHYNYFRDYDPTIGRYIESDPIGLAGGINTFAYVSNLPTSSFDELGLVEVFSKDGIKFDVKPGVGGGQGEHALHGPGEQFHFEMQLGGQKGPRIGTKTFQPLGDNDEKLYEGKFKKVCESLTDKEKALLKRSTRDVFFGDIKKAQNRHLRFKLGILGLLMTNSYEETCSKDVLGQLAGVCD